MKETYQQLVSRVNASSFFVKEHQTSSVPKRSRKVDRIMEAVTALTDEQLRLLVLLMEGKAVEAQVRGDRYILERVEGGWRFHSPAGAVHTVLIDPLRCSCPQNSKAGVACKHMQAVEKLT